MTNALEIKEELLNRGYEEVTISDVTKNSVHLTALSIRKNKDQNIAPCIYVTDEIKELPDATTACDMIVKRISGKETLDIGAPEQLISKEYIMKTIMIGAQRSSDQQLIKRESYLQGIEQFLFIRGFNKDGSSWSIKLTPSIVRHADLDIEEVWRAAEANTFTESEINIQSMHSMLTELMGPHFDGDANPDMNLYVITNKSNLNGAVQIFNSNAIKAWADDHGISKLVMLPSSIHEVIVVPADGYETNLQGFSDMVKDINDTEVDPVDQLSDSAYIIDLAS